MNVLIQTIGPIVVCDLCCSARTDMYAFGMDAYCTIKLLKDLTQSQLHICGVCVFGIKQAKTDD